MSGGRTPRLGMFGKKTKANGLQVDDVHRFMFSDAVCGVR
jgi:hypothetical protein